MGTRNDMHIILNVHPLCKPMQSKIGTHAVKNEWDRGEAKAICKHKRGGGYKTNGDIHALMGSLRSKSHLQTCKRGREYKTHCGFCAIMGSR